MLQIQRNRFIVLFYGRADSKEIFYYVVLATKTDLQAEESPQTGTEQPKSGKEPLISDSAVRWQS